MNVLPKSIEKVIEEFSKLPGIGPKSAARMAYHFLRSRTNSGMALSKALEEMESKFCEFSVCCNVSEENVCPVCSSKNRKDNALCVVEEPLDVVAFEKSGIYDGKYFVIGGVISPADGVGINELRFKELFERVKTILESGISLEIIVATNPSLEGEATANYISEMFSKLVKTGSVKISRLAMGLPTGADLEYADQLTLKRAFEGRRDLI